MLHRFRVRRARRTFASLAMLVGALGLALVSAGGGAAAEGTSTYIVQMLQKPAVAYTGDVAGFPATKPAKGKKIDPDAADVTKYVGYLKTKHDGALAKVGGGQKVYDYGISYNGFAAKLTEGQAAALQFQKDVVAVTPDELVTVDTSSTPHFLGLDAPGGLWAQLGGPDAPKSGKGAGEDIIIGDVDSGIWPESKSFSDRDANGQRTYLPLNTSLWHGRDCHPGENWTAAMCNAKLIGGKWFNAAWGGDAAVEAQRPWEFMSPRDYNGHGTHTASTAGGNHNTPTTGPAAGFGPVSGMAPRARIAVYKALWSTQDASTASGFTSDLVAAIDTAVADGVDAINYSISGTSTNFLDPVEVSFLFAADAGVFASESAGNSGPTTSTVAHPGPWTTTVAAGTHNRNGLGSVTLGNGATYNGASVAAKVGPAPFIDSIAAGLAGADPVKVALCYSKADNAGVAVLDPAKVAGKIVLCDRGVTARVNKSLAVQEANGVGMVLVNPPGTSGIFADFHFVPTVHVDTPSRDALKTYAATPGATATINQSTITFTDPAPFTAAFSSRGPLIAAGGDLLKPDVIAPGQDILAAVAPPGNAGRDFNLYSGTSMSAPHVTGVAALLMQLHPNWSPMAIKSALMTSGTDVLDANISTATRIFRQGAGHIRPNGAADPGLVFDSGFNDWLAFLCGAQPSGVNPATCTALKNAGFSTDPSDMNTASIAIGDLGGIQTVKRRVTNVESSAATYTPSVTGMGGITVDVQPASLSIAGGQTKEFTVKFTRTDAALNAYTGGQLTWSGAGHSVRIPLVVRPVALGAPLEVTVPPSGGSYNVVFGYDGPFSATPRGLVAPATNTGTVADDPGDSFAPGGPGTTKALEVAIPAGTTYARFQLFNADVTPGSDIDLYVFRGSTLVGSSGGGSSDEQVNLVNPAAATYTVWVHGFAVAGAPSPFKLYSWVLGGTSAGNMNVTAPATATTGATGTIELSFSGLAAGTKYLGSVAYAGIAGLPNPTIVRVDTP